MAMIQLPSYFVWLSIIFSFHWFFSNLLTQLSIPFLWIFAAFLIRKTVTRVLRAVEWAFGVYNGSTSGDETNPINGVFGWNFAGVLFNIISLLFYTGTLATSKWSDAVFAATAVTCWASRVESQAAMWVYRSEKRFRVFTVFSACAALLCSSLQWAFLATCPRLRDEATEMIHYMLIVWTATTSIYLLQFVIIYLVHVWWLVVSPDRVGIEFDQMDEVGLSARTIAAAMSLIISLVYFQNRLPGVVQVMMIRRFYGVFSVISMLHRCLDVLSPFPEVHSTGYCVICLEAVKSVERARQLHCGHVFHSHCLRRWLMRSEHCPTCRCPTNQEQKDSFASPLRSGNNDTRYVHDAAIQTTFELEYFPQPPTFHGTIRPLTRPSYGCDAVSDSAVTVLGPKRNNDSNTTLQRRLLMDGVEVPAPLRPDVCVGGEERAVATLRIPEPVALSPGEATNKALGGDEFFDNPISVSSKRQGKRGRYARDSASDTGDPEAPRTTAGTLPRKRKRIESGTKKRQKKNKMTDV